MNSFNKVILKQWDELGRAGYRWWEKVVQVEHFNSLQQVTGIILGETSPLNASLRELPMENWILQTVENREALSNMAVCCR